MSKTLPREDPGIEYARSVHARAALANLVDPETGMPLAKDPRRSGILEPQPSPKETETAVCNTCKTTVVVGLSCPVCSRGEPDPDVLVIEKSGS